MDRDRAVALGCHLPVPAERPNPAVARGGRSPPPGATATGTRGRKLPFGAGCAGSLDVIVAATAGGLSHFSRGRVMNEPMNRRGFLGTLVALQAAAAIAPIATSMRSLAARVAGVETLPAVSGAVAVDIAVKARQIGLTPDPSWWVRGVYWVNGVLDMEPVNPADAPSPFAWYLLLEARKDKRGWSRAFSVMHRELWGDCEPISENPRVSRRHLRREILHRPGVIERVLCQLEEKRRSSRPLPAEVPS